MVKIQIRIKQSDPDQIEKQDPDPYKSEKQDPYQKVWIRNTSFVPIRINEHPTWQDGGAGWPLPWLATGLPGSPSTHSPVPLQTCKCLVGTVQFCKHGQSPTYTPNTTSALINIHGPGSSGNVKRWSWTRTIKRITRFLAHFPVGITSRTNPKNTKANLLFSCFNIGVEDLFLLSEKRWFWFVTSMVPI